MIFDLKIQIQIQITVDTGARNHIDGLVQERRNSIAHTLELRLSRTNLVIKSSGVSATNAILG